MLILRKQKKRLKRTRIIWFVLVVVVLTVGILGARRFDLKRDQQKVLEEIKNVPTATSTANSFESATAVAEKTPVPDELNLQVPFTSQAPTGNWDKQHEENCEEASLLMVNRYFTGRSIISTSDAEEGMAQIVEWENTNLGVSDSIDAEQTARVVREFLKLKAEIVDNPSTDEIKKAVADNKLVLVPASGRDLHNPFFKQPGPLYHMLVIKGYTGTKFVTNDPGTKRGENYVYDFKVVLDANHEWNSGDVPAGAQKMIFVSK